MKLFLLIFPLLLISCSRVVLTNKIEAAKNDGLKQESFFRFSSNRLETIKSKNLVDQGLIKCHQGDTSEGLEIIKSQYNNDKEKPQYWNNQGNCFFLSNDYYKALWSYNIGSTKSKKLNTVAQNNIGVILLNQNNTKEALAVFSELVKKTKNLTPLFNLAHAYLEMGLIQSSNTLFKKLYHKNRNDSDFVFGLALTESLKGNYKYSSGLIRTIQDQDKDDVLFVNALNLYGLKQYEQAQLTLEKQGLVLALNVKKSSQKLHSLIEAKIKEMEKRSQNNRAVANK